MEQPLVIEIVSDVVCPWCFVGKRRLEAALARESDVVVFWRPYQLDVTLPPEGVDRQLYMRAKFKDEARLADVHARLTSLGAQVGIKFDFGAIQRAPNTFDAHRLIRFAQDAGVGDAVVERLFSGYFEHALDIGDREVLIEAAREAGLDGDTIRERLASEEGAAETRREVDAAQRLGVNGVPFFIFAAKYAVSGAQSDKVLNDAIAHARKAAA